MTTTRRTLLGAATACAVTPIARDAAAQTRWQMATPYPDANYHTRNNRQFLEELRAATGIEVQMHTNASLLPLPQIKRGVQQGQVQIGEILLSAYGNEDVFFEVDSIPQLVLNTAQARRLHELSLPFVEARFARQGLTILYMVPWPPSGLYTNAPVESIETLRGMRMRTFNAMTNRFATLVGAAPTLVQAAEVPQAFATGVVNSMVTSAQTGADSAAWDFARIFTPIGFTRTRNAVFMQRRAFEALPAAQQQAVRAAARAAEERGWQMSDEATVAAQNMLQSRGMTIAQPTPALMEGLGRVGETMVQEWVGRAGEDGQRVISAYRAARS
ncbi:MAG TPA: TRAP transporter substrate-binding protein [Acetobacteraceae bacterium]|nr:TRAP transporter substrate-binding protein [Acetobacteraceae bacterium]